MQLEGLALVGWDQRWSKDGLGLAFSEVMESH